MNDLYTTGSVGNFYNNDHIQATSYTTDSCGNIINDYVDQSFSEYEQYKINDYVDQPFNEYESYRADHIFTAEASNPVFKCDAADYRFAAETFTSMLTYGPSSTFAHSGFTGQPGIILHPPYYFD